MDFSGAAQRVIHAKRDRRAEREEAEDRETEDFLAALGVLRTKGEENADAQVPRPPSNASRPRS
jgi:hypothetical protein